MKKLSFNVLAAIVGVLTLTYLAITIIPGKDVATQLPFSCAEHDEGRLMPEAVYQCEEIIHNGDLAQARQLIEKGKAEAADSDEYYQYMVLDTKYYFTTMLCDSFVNSHRRILQYTERHAAHPTRVQKVLQMECALQRGVFEAKMAGRMDTALVYYMKALDILKQLPRDDSYRLMVLSNIADVYKQMGRYDQSISYFRRSLELGDSIGMRDDVHATLLIGIASAYAAMGSFDQSATWWEKAAELKPVMRRAELFHYLNNRGNDYYLQGCYEESLQCFLELDSIISLDSTMVWERMFEWANLSDVYIKLGQPQRALPLLDQTQPFFTSQGQLIPLFYLITQRIELACLDGRYDEALRLVADNPTPDWMIPEQKQLRRKVLIRLYQQTRQWQQYALVLSDYTHLHDSIAGDNLKMRVSDVLMHYEHEKLLLDKQKIIEEKELSFRWAMALLVAAVLLIVLIVIIMVQKQRERRLRESEMRGSIAELRMETVRNRITPHFISNALTAEMVAQMEGRKPSLDELVQLLHRGIELTDMEQSTLSEELEFIRFYCNVESRSVGPDFRLNIDIAEDICTDKVVLPSMSVQILVENAIKHGLKARQPAPGKYRCVWVNAVKKEDATLIEVIDNGVGLAEDRRNKERTGLRVMRQTIHLLNEQNLQSHARHAGQTLMDYGIDNYAHADGQRGCRAWLLLPDDFNYILRKHENTSPSSKSTL